MSRTVSITAPAAATVVRLDVAVGTAVAAGRLLIMVMLSLRNLTYYISQ